MLMFDIISNTNFMALTVFLATHSPTPAAIIGDNSQLKPTPEVLQLRVLWEYQYGVENYIDLEAFKMVATNATNSNYVKEKQDIQLTILYHILKPLLPPPQNLVEKALKEAGCSRLR